MSAIEKMLYNIQKFQVLQLYTSQSALKSVTPAYAFAWDKNIYPVGHHGNDWHEPYESTFKVSREKMEQLGDFLDKLEGEGKTITFYQLEDQYSVRMRSGEGSWDRMELVFACRYFRLNGWFTEDFWKGLVGHSNCPGESKSVLRDFDPEEVYFE